MGDGRLLIFFSLCDPIWEEEWSMRSTAEETAFYLLARSLGGYVVDFCTKRL